MPENIKYIVGEFSGSGHMTATSLLAYKWVDGSFQGPYPKSKVVLCFETTLSILSFQGGT